MLSSAHGDAPPAGVLNERNPAARVPADWRNRPDQTARVRLIWLAWITFVVYGSLVPLEFRPLPLAEAWDRLATAPWLDIGLLGRGDWVSNGVLYLPVGFLGASALVGAGRPSFGRAFTATAATVLFGCVLAVLVEFAQTFFPPRTVSLNDLLAEVLGTLIGAAAALAVGGRLHRLLSAFDGGGRRLLQRLAPLYALAYVAVALFPYDLLLGSGEWAHKIQGPNVGLALAAAARESGSLRLVSRLIAEVLAAVPLGLWWAATWQSPRQGLKQAPVPWVPAVIIGTFVGLAIELAQLMIASGITQGASILTRALGFVGGVAALQFLSRLTVERLRARVRRATVPAVLVLITALTALHGWWSEPWIGASRALRRLAGDVHFLPFYYHYFTTEMHAVASLVFAVVSYAPVGLLCWAWNIGAPGAAAAAVALSLSMEAGRLMMPASHPDPTNILIAAAAAWALHRLLSRLSAGEKPNVGERPQVKADARMRGRNGWRWLLPALVAAGLTATLSRFPVQPLLLASGLLVAAALVAWRPVLLFVLIPAALPLLDLAPWSGRRGFDEFDMLVLITSAVAWTRLPPRARTSRPAVAATTLAFSLVLLSLAISTIAALWSASPPELDALDNPLSAYNALRLAKAAVWAWALWVLALRLRAGGADPVRAFGAGMVLGLAGTVLCIVMERLAFSHLLDFSSDYRVSGPFSAMGLGGAYVECYLVVAMPFLLARMLPPSGPVRFAAGAALLAGVCYALLVTYSRGGYLAMVVGCVLMLLLSVATPYRHGPRVQRLMLGLALLALAATMSYPVLTGSYAQSRLQTISADLDTRERHWRESLKAMHNDGMTLVFGTGLGRFAEAYSWASPPTERPGGHRLISDAADAPALRLGAGYAYFVEQIVAVEPGARYRLTYETRGQPGAALNISLCQKWLIAAFDCAEAAISGGTPAPEADGTWQTKTADLLAPPTGPGRLPRPVRLSLSNAGSTSVDVKNLSLVGVDGSERLRNGAFTAGMDRWTISSDNHLAWHSKSLPLGVFFEQGFLGLAAMTALLLSAGWCALRAVRAGEILGAALLASLCAFVTAGLTDTLLDAPRFLMLWLLLCLLPSALAGSPQAAPKRLRPAVPTTMPV